MKYNERRKNRLEEVGAVKGIGLDIGTTSICGVVYDTQKREVLKEVSADNCFISREEDWSAEQDADEIWESVQTILEELGEIKECKAIGITGQMHGILYVDREGCAVSPLMTWKDARAGRIFRDGMSYGEYLSGIMGFPVYPGYGLATHFYNISNKRIPSGAVKLCTIGDYIGMKLTGEKQPGMERSMAASLGCYSMEKEGFEEERLRRAGISPDWLPGLVLAGTVMGTYQGCPVICACGDNQASFLGAAEDVEQGILVNVGTGSQVTVFHSELLPVGNAEARPFFDRGYLYTGASLNGGKVYERLGYFIQDVCEKFTGVCPEPYEIMGELAGKPGAASLYVKPYLYGSRENPKERGEILHLNQDNFTIRELIGGFLDGMAEELKMLRETLPAEVKKGKIKLYGAGNGLRRNEALTKRVEECFGLSLRFGRCCEEAAQGAAIWACESRKNSNEEGEQI